MFYPGGGRPKGALNRATREIKEFWHGYFSSPEYREEAKKRILSGSAPTLELYLLQLTYGKPREQVDLNVSQAPKTSPRSPSRSYRSVRSNWSTGSLRRRRWKRHFLRSTAKVLRTTCSW